MGVVFWKELADHFSSRRFMILLALIAFTAAWATYVIFMRSEIRA